MEKRLLSESLRLESPWRKAHSRLFPEPADAALQRVTEENQRLMQESWKYQAQVHRLEQELRMPREPAPTRLETDYRPTQRSGQLDNSYSLMSKLSSMESQRRITENEVANLRFELERTARIKTAVEGQNNFLKAEVLRLKEDLETETSARVTLVALHEELQRDAEMLRSEAQELQTQLSLRRQELLTADRQMREINAQLSDTLEEKKKRERECESLTVTHALAMSQNTRLEQQNAVLLKEAKERKSHELRILELEADRDSLAQELQRKTAQTTELEATVSDREREIAELREDAELLQRQNSALVQEKELHQHRATSLSKKLAIMENDLKTAEDDLCRAQQETGALQDRVADSQRRVSLTDRAENDAKRFRALYFEAVEAQKQAMARLEDLETRLDGSRSEPPSNLRKQLEESQEEVANLTDENRRLEAKISALEAAKSDLAIRLDQTTDSLRAAESAVKRLETDLKTAKDLAAAREKELKQVAEGSQRESHDNLYLRKLLDEQKDLNEQLALSLRNKEQDSTDALERVIALQRQLDELKSQKGSEISTLRESLQQLQDEVYDLEQEKSRLKQAYESATRSERAAQQVMKSLEKEKDELIVAQKSALEDRLTQSVGNSDRDSPRGRDQDELIAHYRAQVQSLEAALQSQSEVPDLLHELDAERQRVEQLEELLQEQQHLNAELTDEHGELDTEEWKGRVDQQREEILALEMEVMRLKDELGKSKHLQFKAESRAREVERKFATDTADLSA